MRSLRSHPLFALVLLAVLLLPVRTALAEIKILTVPGFPFFLVMDLRYGNEVRDLVFRTPDETKSLDSFKGLVYIDETPVLTYADRDWRKDLLWKIHFSEPVHRNQPRRGRDLWVASLSGRERIWIGSAETGPSIWDNALRQVEAPEGTTYLIPPSLPVTTSDLSSRPGNGLPMVYTIRLTREGPRFVIVPPVYRQLLDIAERARSGEKDPDLRASYDNVFEDFKAMSLGHLPSMRALTAFPWKSMGRDGMKP